MNSDPEHFEAYFLRGDPTLAVKAFKAGREKKQSIRIRGKDKYINIDILKIKPA